MNQQQNSLSWKQKKPAEKASALAGWMVIAILLWNWFTVGKSDPAVSQPLDVSRTITPSPLHTHASVQALASAEQYLLALDQAMAVGMRILQVNSLPQLTAHSRVFRTLMRSGNKQFGQSALEPLGQCGAAGLFAYSWWLTQVSVAGHVNAEHSPGAFRSDLYQYYQHRNRCLEQAKPSIRRFSW